jgi:hypothetical protein
VDEAAAGVDPPPAPDPTPSAAGGTGLVLPGLPSLASNAIAPPLPPAVAAAIPLPAFAGTVAARAKSGATDFDIRLDPPDLGQVSVHLTIGADGQVGAHFTVERAATLDLLRKDVGGLQDALQQAGLSSNPGATSFQLKSDGGQSSGWQPSGQQQQQALWQQAGQQSAWQQSPQHRPPPLPPAPPPPGASPAPPPSPAYRPRSRPAGGLDVIV